MTRKSKREIERMIEGLGDAVEGDGPDEFVLRETIVGTDGEHGSLEPGEERVEEYRVYRENGEWHHEEIDINP